MVNSSLLRKYRLSTEEFRRRFKNERKKPKESYVDFAYHLHANFVEWVKGVKVHGNHDGLLEFVCLDQFYETLPDEMRLWIQDRPNVVDVRKAAELADDYVS